MFSQSLKENNMDDKSIIFFSIVMIIVFFYRIFLSILLLFKKKNMIDEKYYIMVFYCSLVSILVLLTNLLVLGTILIAILPIILILYISLFKSRVYWIINGYQLSESTFVNQLVLLDERYANPSYRISRVKISRKIKEEKTKLEFTNISFEEKEKILKLFNQLINESTFKANKSEWKTIIIYSIMIFVLLCFIIFALFT